MSGPSHEDREDRSWCGRGARAMAMSFWCPDGGGYLQGISRSESHGNTWGVGLSLHHSKPEPFWPKFTIQVHKFVAEPILFAIWGWPTFVPCSFGASLVSMRCHRAVGIAWSRRRTGSCSWWTSSRTCSRPTTIPAALGDSAASAATVRRPPAPQAPQAPAAAAAAAAAAAPAAPPPPGWCVETFLSIKMNRCWARPKISSESSQFQTHPTV